MNQSRYHRFHGRNRSFALLSLLISTIRVLSSTLCCISAQQFDGDDFVNEILEEERMHYGDYNDPFQRDEDVLREQERKAQAENDLRMAQTERIRMEREALFQKDFAKMNQEQQKRAKAQKKKDASIVNNVLKGHERNDLYGVLGLRYLELQIPSRRINLGVFHVTIPAMKWFHKSEKAIKKAYRNRSRLVHPDRNRDGRANEAFIALEECASILLDEKQRAVYDAELKASRRRQYRRVSSGVKRSFGVIVSTSKRTFKMVRSVLGPFAFPVTILGCLVA
ncbi:hypothetical protein MPSEU_000884500 [Mayamaea pseudoterrestris]|nr:hypothetical protein MPSEU_000884500 [Mayamaea pseudoterrestris]